MNQLKIFISSTCYDLSQIRSDLHDFISSAGHHPIMSEKNTFPIDPNNNTIENCIKNVATADILVLILGNRYGYETEDGKSITITEYLYAKQNGIPIYIFIFKPLISALKIWKGNKNGDFSNTVDSPKLFEFVDELRSDAKNWCFNFEEAKDITNTLKIQFSHLFKQSLELRKKYRVSDQPEFYKHLSPKAINLALRKDEMFETLFFMQVLKDELEKYEDLKIDLEYKILISCSREINDIDELIKWMSVNFETIQHLTRSVGTLFNTAYKDFNGEPGTPSDLKGLYYVACGMAKIYKEMILWSINIKSAKVNSDFLVMRDALSDFPAKSLELMWNYPSRTMGDIQYALDSLKSNPNQTINIHSLLTFEMDKNIMKIFNDEMDRLSGKSNN